MSYVTSIYYDIVRIHLLKRTNTPYDVVRSYRTLYCVACLPVPLKLHCAAVGPAATGKGQAPGLLCPWAPPHVPQPCWIVCTSTVWTPLRSVWCTALARGKHLLLVCIPQQLVSHRSESELWLPPLWNHKLARVCTSKRMRTRHSKRRLHAIAGNLELIMWAGSWIKIKTCSNKKKSTTHFCYVEVEWLQPLLSRQDMICFPLIVMFVFWKIFDFQDISANLLSLKRFNYQVEDFHALLGELTSHPRSIIILLYRIPTWNPILTLSVSVWYCRW